MYALGDISHKKFSLGKNVVIYISRALWWIMQISWPCKMGSKKDAGMRSVQSIIDVGYWSIHNKDMFMAFVCPGVKEIKAWCFKMMAKTEWQSKLVLNAGGKKKAELSERRLFWMEIKKNLLLLKKKILLYKYFSFFHSIYCKSLTHFADVLIPKISP